MNFINEKTAPVIKFVAGTAAGLIATCAVTRCTCACIEFVGTITNVICNKIENL